MTVTNEDRDVVARMFKAMQTGLTAEDDMMALFAEDAVFTEPFSGAPRTHHGKDAIRACFVEMWNEPGPEVTLTVGRIDMDGEAVRAEWTCTSPVFVTPMRGHDLFRIQGGLIRHLEIVVTDMPPMDMGEHGEG